MAKETKYLYLSGNSPLLNFAISPIRLPHPYDYDEQPFQYQTVEHYFQAMKCMCLREDALQTLEETHDWIAKSQTPIEAKQRGRRVELDLELWERSAFAYMLAGHTAKFTQIPSMQRELMKTKGYILVEHRPDPIWGDNKDGSGLNLCGKSLMIVRDRILS